MSHSAYKAAAGGFAVVLCLYTIIVGLYLRNIVIFRKNFFLTLRVRFLLATDAISNLAVVSILLIRQIMVNMGGVFPCEISKFAFYVPCFLHISCVIIRAMRLIISVDKGLRKKYYRYLTPWHIRFAVLALILFGLFIWSATWNAPLCKNICHHPSCFLGSDWKLGIVMILFYNIILSTLGKKVEQLHLADVNSIMVELYQMAQIVGWGGFLYFLFIILVDIGVADGLAAGNFITIIMFILQALGFLATALVPAMRHGYAPLLAASNRIHPVDPVTTPSQDLVARLEGKLLSQQNSLFSATDDPTDMEEGGGDDITLDYILEEDGLRKLFMEYCRVAACEEAARFVMDFRMADLEPINMDTRALVRQRCMELVDMYIKPGSQYMLPMEESCGISRSRLVHEMYLFGRRSTVFIDECIENMALLRVVHDHFHRTLAESIVPAFKRTKEYRLSTHVDDGMRRRNDSFLDDSLLLPDPSSAPPSPSHLQQNGPRRSPRCMPRTSPRRPQPSPSASSVSASSSAPASPSGGAYTDDGAPLERTVINLAPPPENPLPTSSTSSSTTTTIGAPTAAGVGGTIGLLEEEGKTSSSVSREKEAVAQGEGGPRRKSYVGDYVV